MPTELQVKQKIGQKVILHLGDGPYESFPMDVLIFVGEGNRKVPFGISDSAPLEHVIRRFFVLTAKYPSVIKTTKELQCRRAAYRSVWDIWRHVVDVRPEYSLFDIMGALVRMRGELRVQYCKAVNKRVFYPANWVRPSGFMLHDSDHVDELGLTFPEWEVFA